MKYMEIFSWYTLENIVENEQFFLAVLALYLYLWCFVREAVILCKEKHSINKCESVKSMETLHYIAHGH